MKPILLLLLAGVLSFTAGAVSIPKVVIDCGSMSGKGVLLIEIDGQKYFVKIDCGSAT